MEELERYREQIERKQFDKDVSVKELLKLFLIALISLILLLIITYIYHLFY